MPAASSIGRVQSRTPAVHGGILNVNGAARLHIERRPPPTAPDHREADMKASDPPSSDEWTCQGQADLFDELEAMT